MRSRKPESHHAFLFRYCLIPWTGLKIVSAMKRFGKKLKWGLILLALLLVLMGAYAYFIGTSTMLSQAEAFAFRRMTVPQLAEQGTFQFFYASNRRPAAMELPSMSML